MNEKSWKQLIQAILLAKVILKKMVLKISILANVQIFNWVSGVGCGNYIYSSKSKGLSDENVTALNTSDYKINLDTFGPKTKV